MVVVRGICMKMCMQIGVCIYGVYVRGMRMGCVYAGGLNGCFSWYMYVDRGMYVWGVCMGCMYGVHVWGVCMGCIYGVCSCGAYILVFA